MKMHVFLFDHPGQRAELVSGRARSGIQNQAGIQNQGLDVSSLHLRMVDGWALKQVQGDAK